MSVLASLLLPQGEKEETALRLSAKPAWGRADHLRGSVRDLQHGERALVGAIRAEAEDAVLTCEP
jgi:hypothetical protein